MKHGFPAMRILFKPELLGLIAVALMLAVPGTGAAVENDPPSFQGRQFPFTILRPVEAAPATPLHTLKGGVTTLRRFTGKVVLLNVWATWCPACLYEMPKLDQLQAKIGGAGFTVVSLSVDAGGGKQVLPYLRRLGIKNLPVYLDPAGRTAEALEMTEGMPWSFIIDHRGRVMGYVKGAADWESPEGLALIRYYTDRISR
jgi:thiol-disulfide isomerase/thioredoxin